MCSKIVIMDELTGEVVDVAQTVGELKKLGIDPVFNKTANASQHANVSCLCGVDVIETARRNGFACSLKNNVYTFVFDNEDGCVGNCDVCDLDCEERDDMSIGGCCEICGEEDCEGECEDECCEICGEEDCDGFCEADDGEYDEEEIEYSEWMPVQWPDSSNWFVADSQGKTICLFNNENVDTKEAAELVAIAPEMLHIIQRYYTGKSDAVNSSIARNFLKKFKMID
jgi:hypothetical protein